MSVTVGVDSYVDETQLQAYADARGITLSTDLTILLIKAMDYYDTLTFSGTQTDEDQDLHFPVNGSDTVPTKIEKGQMVAATLIDSGEGLLDPVERAVKMEKIDVLETEYMDNAATTTQYTELNSLLRPYLISGLGGTYQFSVNKA